MSIIPVEQLTEIVRKTRAVFENSSLVSSVHQKGPIDFVTDADMQVQALLSAELSALCPDIQFMGEEKDNSEIDRDGTLWILDPIDGTTNLIHHFCHSTVSLALASHRTVVAAIVYNPYTDELFSAEKGKGAFLNGAPIHASRNGTLQQSVIFTGTSPYYHEYADWIFGKAREIYLCSQDIRRIGSAALELAYVAAGRADGFYESRLSPWDYAAGLLLIQEAGGTVTDLSGRALDCTAPSSVLASNGLIHGELEAILSPGPQGIEQDADKDNCPQGTP